MNMSARPVRAKRANTRLAAYQCDLVGDVSPPKQLEVGDQADLVQAILPAPLAVPPAPELSAGGGLSHLARRGGGGQDCRGGRGRAGGRRNALVSLSARPPGFATPTRPTRLAFTPADTGRVPPVPAAHFFLQCVQYEMQIKFLQCVQYETLIKFLQCVQ